MDTARRDCPPTLSDLVASGPPWVVCSRQASEALEECLVGSGWTLERPPCWPGHRLFPEHHLPPRTFTLAGRAGPEGSSPAREPGLRDTS